MRGSSLRSRGAWLAAAALAVGALAVGAAPALATPTKANPRLNTITPPVQTLGTTVVDTGILSGGRGPTGTITFTLYGPGDPTCSFNVVSQSSDTVSGNGAYFSAPYTPFFVGTYHWVVAYSGDNSNNAVTSACNESNTMTYSKVNTSISSQTQSNGGKQPALDPSGLSVPAIPINTTIWDKAFLIGFFPTGTVTFSLYGPTDPTCSGTPAAVFTVPADGGFTYYSPQFVPSQAGVYNWVDSYSGDALNNPVTSYCGADRETVGVGPILGGSYVPPPTQPTLPTLPSPNPPILLGGK